MSQKSPKIFYGWWVVAATSIIALYVGGGLYYGFTAIFEPIVEEFGWSYAQVAFAASVRGMEAGLLAPLYGFLVDRWGPRRLFFTGILFASGGLMLLSRINSLATFYGAFVIIAIGTSSCTTTVLFSAVANWFRKRVGLAIGIVISGFASGGILVPLIAKITDLYGWRTAVVLMAIGMLVICLPLSLLVRHKPEQYGYVTDGEANVLALDAEAGTLAPDEVSVTLGQAIRSGAFWRMALAFVYLIGSLNLIITHVMPYLSSVGVSRSVSGLIATAIPLVSIIGRVGFGWLADRIDRRRVAALNLAMMGLGTFCFAYLANFGMWLIIPFFILFGFGFGGAQVMRPTLARDYFGRANFGRVFGTMDGIVMLCSLVAPPLAGWVYDTWGSYQGILLALGGVSLLAVVSVLTIAPVKAQPEIETLRAASLK